MPRSLTDSTGRIASMPTFTKSSSDFLLNVNIHHWTSYQHHLSNHVLEFSLELITILANLSFSEGSFLSLSQASSFHSSPQEIRPQWGPSVSLPPNFQPKLHIKSTGTLVSSSILISSQTAQTLIPSILHIVVIIPQKLPYSTLLTTFTTTLPVAEPLHLFFSILAQLSTLKTTPFSPIVLQSSFRVYGLALSWISSYVANYTQIARIGNSFSDVIPLSTQGRLSPPKPMAQLPPYFPSPPLPSPPLPSPPLPSPPLPSPPLPSPPLPLPSPPL